MTVVQTYAVDVVFNGRDQGATAMSDRVGASLQGLQGRLDGAASMLERVGVAAAALGAGAALAGIRAVTQGLYGLHTQAENTNIAIAGMLQANNAAGSLVEGLGQAQTVVGQIRRDAAALPGEASDFVQVFQTALPAAIQAGMRNSLDVARFTNQFGAVGTVFGIDAAQVGRDLRFMLQGHAGAQVAMWNQLSALIGKSAAEFNSMTAPERLAAIQRAIGAYAPMVGRFGNTLTTQVTTLTDTWNRARTTLTAPVFEHASKRLEALNTYLAAHGPEIESQLHRWGLAGAHAFDVVMDKGRHAVTYLREHWRGLVGEIRESIQSALALYAGLRVAAGATGAIGTGVSLAQGAVGVLGGTGAATVGAAGLAAGAGATVAVGAMALAVHDGLFDLDAALVELQPTITLVKQGFTDFVTEARPLLAQVGAELAQSVVNIVTALGKVAYVALEFGAGVSRALRWVNEMRTNAVGMLIGGRYDAVNSQDDVNSRVGSQAFHDAEAQRDRERDLRAGDLRAFTAAVTQRPTDRQRDPAAQARKGHTTIHNHFRVEQADNPERLALGVMHILTRELRNPTQSARPGLTTLRP